MTEGMLLLGILFSSFVPGVLIFFLGEQRRSLRTTLNMLGATTKLGLLLVLFSFVYRGQDCRFDFEFLPGILFSIGADANSLLFLTLSTVLWFWTTIYAVGYLEDSPNRRRFFGFFSLCVTATTGIALAQNLITFLTFFELLTLATAPLVMHRGTAAAMRGGITYLAYTLTGGAILLLAVVWLHGLVGPVQFEERGVITQVMAEHRGELQILFLLFVVGIGVKAAIFPLHGWLPKAMVAPAPVSALLHAVAVVKAGAFGIVRIVFDVYGVQNAAALGVLLPLAIVAAVTILYGSLRALFEDELKKRLAFSTISQVSYILLGISIVGPLATIGGLVHLVHQGLMKITLFFAAGNCAETLGIHRVSQMNGVGRRMPWTMAAFTIAALGMIGIPPLAGSVSKHYLQLGAEAASAHWVGHVLLASSLMNAGYFLPILYRAWFRKPPANWPEEHHFGRLETHWMLLVPTVVTALLVVYAGVFADTPFSPLSWVKLIAEREYRQ